MDKHTKLTLEMLLARKTQRDAAKAEFHSLYVPELDGCLLLQKIPLSRVLELLDAVDSTSMTENYQFQSELIYACCPMLRDKELQSAFGCTDPADIVGKVFDDNMGAISDVASAILDFYGLGERAEVKNHVKN